MPFADILALAPDPRVAPDPVVTDRNRDHWSDEGWALLQATARRLGLTDAVKERRLTPEQGRRLLMAIVGTVEPLLVSITESLIAGAIKLWSWWKSFRTALVPGHFAGAMALLNEPVLAPADLLATEEESNRQAGFLLRWRDQIATGDHILGGASRSRASLYAHAVWSTAVGVFAGKMKREGFGEESNQLGVSDHCLGCLGETSRGWVRVGELVPVGLRQCGPRCHCYIIYRGVDATVVARATPAQPEPIPVAAPSPPPTLSAPKIKFIADERSINNGEKVVRASVARLDRQFAKDANDYVAAGGVGPSSKPASYVDAMRNVQASRVAGAAPAEIAMPRVYIDTSGNVSFADGRHRFAAARDAGIKTIPVTVPADDLKAVRRLIGKRIIGR